MLLQQVGKVGVLRHDSHVCSTRGGEDFMVRRALEVQITNWQALKRKRGTHPLGERRWKLIVEPKRHAATIG